MKKKKIIWYNPKLIPFARELRNHSTKSEIIFWLKIKGKVFYGYDFHRQKPIDNYILDFYCDALLLGIEIDGYSHQFLEVFNKDTKKEKRMNEFWHLDCARYEVLRFSDEQVLKDMENVIRALEDYIYEFEKHTPGPFSMACIERSRNRELAYMIKEN